MGEYRVVFEKYSKQSIQLGVKNSITNSQNGRYKKQVYGAKCFAGLKSCNRALQGLISTLAPRGIHYKMIIEVKDFPMLLTSAPVEAK